MRFLVDIDADVTLISFNSWKKFPDALSTKQKDQSLEIHTVNGEKIKNWGPAQVNSEVKGVTLTTQIYASDLLKQGRLGSPALKNLWAIWRKRNYLWRNQLKNTKVLNLY